MDMGDYRNAVGGRKQLAAPTASTRTPGHRICSIFGLVVVTGVLSLEPVASSNDQSPASDGSSADPLSR
ncbi:hypothetical protein I551_3353 [Mycobacterium ulcerans str. Harvey]|uniref:Uncharacterized protein n=1 Tax=Mycobacterium ulcerans str. Harvey TaxID=1299332 RepID=A0ABP3AFZ3_MYCUL|nr:hypothetical protein I551_3353 [Mycobacterium ulcerans str. Harvey]